MSYYYYDFNPPAPNVNKLELPQKLIHHIDDWDTEQTIYIEVEEENKNFLLAYEDSLSVWEKKFTSDSLLYVSHLSKDNDEILIGGSFIGNLEYDLTSMADVDNYSAFLLSLSFAGEVNSIQIVEGLDLADKVCFSENRDGEILIAGRVLNNSITINGSNTNLSDNNGLFVINATQNFISVLKDIDESIGTRLLDVAYSYDKSLVSLAFWESNGSSGDTTDGLWVRTYNPANNWSYDEVILKGSAINKDKFDMMASSLESDLYLGVTFEGGLLVSNNDIQSYGGEDIVLLKISQTSGFQWMEHIGTEDQEDVSEILFEKGILNFGGVFSGSNRLRKLGDCFFINSSLSEKRAYVSFITYESLNPNALIKNGENQKIDVAGQKLESVQNEKNNGAAATGSFKIYPNPFKDIITIRTNDSNVDNIVIMNTLNQRISQHAMKGNNSIEVDLKNLATGIYYIGAYNEAGELLYSKKVVKD